MGHSWVRGHATNTQHVCAHGYLTLFPCTLLTLQRNSFKLMAQHLGGCRSSASAGLALRTGHGGQIAVSFCWGYDSGSRRVFCSLYEAGGNDAQRCEGISG